jgi:hypothetical protein
MEERLKKPNIVALAELKKPCQVLISLIQSGGGT